ncbi:Rha family transcriptional regulator [Pseudomonas germanica]|uniref:Rha family transcriptional regulator n=1 Tax=Pseudomonas germanica TaxID=2815720 RepID=A0ABX8YVT5_9PSED|nr:Rha family transcriptional regulator [Pseudomonas germanica]QYY84003.1 Rha family transcriptional regulator [Pseudomonas germanica]
MHSSPNTINTPKSVATLFSNSGNVSRSTMSSREIANVTGKRHDNVKRTIEDLAASGLVHPQSEDEWSRDKLGRARATRIYNICERDSYVIVAQLSPEFTSKLVDRWQELERVVAAQAALPANNSKIVGELAILECFDRLLKPAPSSKMMMLAKIAANNGLDAKFLPGYAVDAAPDAAGGSSMPTKSATALLKDGGIRCAPAAFNRALADQGFLKQLQRKNSKHEMVDFWSVTDKGLKYGKNLTSPQSPRETQPHWYVDRFLELAKLVGKA